MSSCQLIDQREMTINKYFTKVRVLYHEICELDSTSVISESRIRRVIIYGLKPKQKNFVAPVQGWEV